MEFLGDFLDMLSNLAMALPGGKTPLAKKIETARQKQWVVLVAASTPSSKQPDFQEQKKLLSTAAIGLQERSVLVIYLPHGELVLGEEMYLYEHISLRLKGFEVVLIGKDGKVKLRATHPLTPQVLFDTIDRVSMSTQSS